MSELRACGGIVRHGGGDRFSHAYCDALPKGHDGRCEERPLGARLAAAWIKAATDQACPHTEHAMRSDGRYGRHFPSDVSGAGVWELCPETVKQNEVLVIFERMLLAAGVRQSVLDDIKDNA